MKKFDYQKFNKRYNKFKKNNLPTPFWDEERQTLEYVYYTKDANNKDFLEVHNSIADALGNIAYTGLYYSFTSRHIESWLEDGKRITKAVTAHDHAHSFDEVVRALYNGPESFNISKEEERFFSKQELKYLKRVQKYLLFIGLKDINTIKTPASRFNNKRQAKYKDTLIISCGNDILTKILSGDLNYRAINWYPECVSEKKYNKGEFQALITDENEDVRLFIEFNKREVKLYKDIKKLHKIKNQKDNDKVIVEYFKILERF